MIGIVEKSNCCGCGACVNACPAQCISMEEDEEGFLYPKADETRCTDCGLCGRVCVCQREEPSREKEPLCYAVLAKDDALRESSSSGGVFSLLADNVLASGGVVYGVAMEENMRSCSHIRITSAGELPKLRGSKYLQSCVGETYRLVKIDLEAGKQVLFSGVPCQIDALKLFLDREYENLYCAEVICHGAPSPLLWREYVDYIERKHQGTVRSVRFRSKKNGWKKYGLAIDGENIHQDKNLSSDPYLIMFSRDYCLRPSCYQCQAKKLESAADLTLGDFWGIWKNAPGLDDDNGTSLVMVQSEKGAELFQRIESFIVCREMPFSLSVASNPAYHKSVGRPKERENFFPDLNSNSFDVMIKKYCSLSPKERLKKTALFKVFRKVFS